MDLRLLAGWTDRQAGVGLLIGIMDWAAVGRFFFFCLGVCLGKYPGTGLAWFIGLVFFFLGLFLVDSFFLGRFSLGVVFLVECSTDGALYEK